MSLMPVDQNNPLYKLLMGGMAMPSPQIPVGQMNLPPSFGQRLGAMVAPQAGAPQQGLRGLLSNPDFAMALLANSGGPQRRSFGEILGQSGLQTQQMGQQREDDAFKRRYMEAQMAAMGGKKQAQPSSVQEYEYAKANGFKGSFQEWITAGGQTSRPSAVQEWEFYNSLIEEDKKNNTNRAQLYLEMKRNPNFAVKEVNQVPTSIQQSIVGGVNTLPLSTLPQTAAAAETVKQAEQRGGAVGTAQGQIVGGIQTKGSDAEQMMGAIQMAGGLLDKSTGSWAGSLIDKGAAVFGRSTEGAQAGAQLKVLQASLLSFVPKMSGPQSDADREVYIQAVGQIGDTNTPVETRKAALKTVQDMQNKYIQNAGGMTSGSGVKPKETAAERAKRLGL
jgi:hypothetical protein